MSESLKNKTVKGTVWSSLDAFLGQGITFLVGLVLARLLSPEEYGLIAIITIFISVFNSIVDSGFSNALIRKQDATEADYNTVFYTNLAISAVLSTALFFGAPLIADFFSRPQLTPLTKAMSSVVIINAFAIVQNIRLTKNIDFKTKTKVSLIASLTSGVIGIAMAFGGFGVWSLVAQQISKQLLNSVFLWFFIRWMPKLLFSWKSFKEMFDFGWKLLVSGLINTIWTEIYQVIIGKFYQPQTLGQYTRAQQFSSIFSSNLTSIIQRVSYPVLSQLQDDKERLKSGYKRIIKITMLVSFVLMLGLAAIAKPMILVLIGDKWLPAVPFLQILCFNMMLYPLHSINLNMLQVQGRSDLFLKLEIVKKIVGVIPLCLGIFVNIYYMLIGSVFVGFFSYYLNARYSGPFLNYSIKEQVKDIMPGFSIALLVALPVYAISYLPLNPFILLPMQLLVGLLIVLILCEKAGLEEYKEIKSIVLGLLKK